MGWAGLLIPLDAKGGVGQIQGYKISLCVENDQRLIFSLFEMTAKWDGLIMI
jgi:hypothetical protein